MKRDYFTAERVKLEVGTPVWWLDPVDGRARCGAYAGRRGSRRRETVIERLPDGSRKIVEIDTVIRLQVDYPALKQSLDTRQEAGNAHK
jgi:hypothetical protein